MIDFIKGNLEGVNIESFEVNQYLKWESKVDCETLDVLSSIAQAKYKGLLFKIISPNEKRKFKILNIEGSLHKYWNNGEHNFNDFTIDSLWEVLDELKFKFNIQPFNVFLTQLETGVNINPDYRTETILNCCLMHKRKQFKWVSLSEDSNYIQAFHRNCIIKIYDKKLQYSTKGFNLKNEIMRFELKMKRPYFSRIIGKSSRVTLEDILDFGLQNFKTELLNNWNYILFYDSKSIDKTEFADRYSNINFWNRLDNYQYRYHRENLNSRIRDNPSSIKNYIGNKISIKTDFLTTLLEPYNI